MARTGIQRIDDLFGTAAGAVPIHRGDADADAVGAVQDLLVGQGVVHSPYYTVAGYGLFGPKTERSVKSFQKLVGLPQTGSVDRATLRALAQRRPADPRSVRATRAYIALALDIPYDRWVKTVALVSIKEGNGRFAALNRNTDKEGLSLGIIQWAQSKKRLVEILRAMRAQNRTLFDQNVGGTANADGMIAHADLSTGGVYPNFATTPAAKRGLTRNSDFDFINTPWVERFGHLCGEPEVQKAQVREAIRDFAGMWDAVQAVPGNVIRSERGVSFMVDLMNQHGRNGGMALYRRILTPMITEPAALSAMSARSVAIVRNKYKDVDGKESNETRGTRERREWFRTTPLLADTPF